MIGICYKILTISTSFINSANNTFPNFFSGFYFYLKYKAEIKNLIKYRQTAFEKVKNVLSKSWQDATLNELIFDNTGDCNVIKQKRNLLLMTELELERRQLALE